MMVKRLLPILLFAISLNAVGQKKHQYTFSFSHPENLLPSIDMSDGQVNISDSTFISTDSLVYVKFLTGSLNLGSYIMPQTIDDVFKPYLYIGRGSRMIVKSVKYAEIETLEFSSDSYVGDMYLESPRDMGIISPFENWYGNGNTVTTLNYVQRGEAPRIYAFTVEYITPMDLLLPVSTTPEENGEIYSFTQFVLNYKQKVKVAPDKKFTLYTDDVPGFRPITLQASVDKSDSTRVIVSLPEGTEPITDLGSYILSIDEGAIIANDADGYWNKAVKYHFDIVESFATFNMLSVEPDTAGIVEFIPNKIILNFPEMVKNLSTEVLKLYDHEGVEERSLTASYVDGDSGYSKIQLTFNEPFTLPVNSLGVHRLVIPEKFLWNKKYTGENEEVDIANGARFNPEIVLEWNIGGVEYISDERIAEIQQLLDDNIGVGYPVAESESRKKLQEFIDSKIGTEEQINNAIAEFYTDTDIQMPEKDKWYSISSVGSDSKKLYLSYDEEKVMLTDNAANAGKFQSICKDTLFFQTRYNKYLHLPISEAFDEVYSGTSSKNLTEELDSVINAIKLTHLNIDGVDSVQSFGLFSVWGSLGKKPSGDYSYAYALINNENAAVMTNPEMDLQFFTPTLTNAFRIEEVEAPLPNVDYVLSPDGSIIEIDLHTITITFPYLTVVNKASDIKISMSKENNSYVITTDSVAIVEGKTNSFVIVFNDTPNGKCVLTIPRGTFTYEHEGTVLDVPEIIQSYTLGKTDFIYDFANYYSLFIEDNLSTEGYVKDVALNYILIYAVDSRLTGIGVSSEKKVTIETYVNPTIVAEGRLVEDKSFVLPGFEYVPAMRLVLDNPIKEGDLKPGRYVIAIPGAAFGDMNYAKWLEDPSSVRKNECHVNDELLRYAYVDNEKASGIRHLTVDEQNDKVYDLSGRRMNGNVKPGLYIMNGKKVVVK